MASDRKDLAPNVESAVADDGLISMVDILHEEEQLEADANAVLGGSDDKCCTYPDGYIRRQALYACETCSSESRKPAGICLACSYACHEGHDLHELYTKRNFRCDCGNKKFTDLKCKLYPCKEGNNEKNSYNQNFQGLYCICSRPYPDPLDEVEDEMIQCVVCEDWYHGRHLNAKVPVNEDYQEMICPSCMKKHEFLWAYQLHCNETETIKKDNPVEDVEVCTEGASEDVKNGLEALQTVIKTEETVLQATTSSCSSESPICHLKELQQREVTVTDSAAFWPDSWRSKLCQCDSCLSLYQEQVISFLCEETDTVLTYEQKGKTQKTPITHQDRERRALEGMNRVQQIEMVQGFNDMKSALSDYLRHFAENGKVVREEDIREFFSQMQARKKQKTSSVPQYLCR